MAPPSPPPKLPGLPTFATSAEERQYVKSRLAAAYRLFAVNGLDVGALGHVTARDPEHPDTFWISPFGRHFGLVKVSDLLRVDAEGNVVEGRGYVNPAAVVTHSVLYAARTAIKAIAHAHSFWGKLWSTTGRPLGCLTQEACSFFEDHVVVPIYEGIVSTREEVQRTAALMGERSSAILKNHGLLTVGTTVDAAVWRYILLEQCCELQVQAQRLEGTQEVDPEVARQTRARAGSEYGCWGMFQPLYNQIVRQQPELLE